jgi:isoleucyl-tRNA synthetase
MESENVGVLYPADLYLEGKDQHRGWFQSSLLTSLALHEQPAMKEIVTHGFTVDEKGRKMSKSIGNVVTPGDIIKDMGNDGLRLWVASNDYDSDPIVSKNLMSNVAEVHRKIRNTCRFLLSNLYDFNFDTDAIAVEKMLLIDQYALCKLDEVNQAILQAYKDRKTTAVFHDLADYCVKELSSFYLDIVKDRLYVEKPNGFERRSAQTVCYYIVDTLTKAMAPVLSFTAELIADCYQTNKKRSIHLQDFNDLSFVHERLFDVRNYGGPLHHKNMTNLVVQEHSAMVEFQSLWDAMKEIRNAVLKSLEELRGQGVIKHSLDAAVRLHVASDFKFHAKIEQLFARVAQQGQSLEHFLKEYFIVSQVIITMQAEDMPQVAPGLFVHTAKADGGKCARCWQWEISDKFDQEKQLCQRCKKALQ